MRCLFVLAAAAAACGTERTPSPVPLPAPDRKAPLLEPGERSERIASYSIDAALDVTTHRITGRQTLTWRHTKTAPVSELPFHLYLNAFKNDQSVFMRESRGSHRRARASRQGGWGWIEVSSLKIAGEELRPRARYGEDETVLTVPLPRPIAPGETVSVEMTFLAQLPEVFARTGYKGDFHMVAQWFPKIGVLVDGNQWHCEPFHVNSEFFADFGTYDVVLRVPDTHVVAATGVLVAATPSGNGMRTLTYRAEDVHDFVWTADPYFRMISAPADTGRGIADVRVYYRPEQEAFAARHLEAAKRSVEGFSRMFYPYPWSIMSIIDVPLEAVTGAGGMEYPTLVTTAGDSALTPPGVWLPEQVTVHEVGHNWFQGLLASNEVDEAWLDEGVNEYVDGIILDDWLGADRSALDWAGYRIGYYPLHRQQSDPSDLALPIATRSYEFPTQGQYGGATYMKTCQVLKTLEGMVGRPRMIAALAAYARKHAFGHPTRADLFAALRAELGDWSWFLEPAFLGTGGVDYRLASLSVRPHRPPRGVFGEGDGREERDPPESEDEWVSEVLVLDVGEVPAHVDLELRFSDGAVVRETWDGRGRWKRLSYVRKARLVAAFVDPDDKLLLEYRRGDNQERDFTRSGPAWRAAARASFWAQTLMQVVGL